MKVNKLDVTVALIAAATCLGLLCKIPVWAIFFGWAWYFAMGAKPDVFKRAVPPMLLGYLLAAVAIVAYAASGFQFWVIASTVCVTVFLLMLSLKTRTFAESLPSFNAYSCLFAGYYAADFPKLADGGLWDVKNVLLAAAWIAMANVVGLVCGFVSIKIGVPGPSKQA